MSGNLKPFSQVGAATVAAAVSFCAFFASFFGASSSTAAQVVEHEYVGAERCKSCHAAEYTIWAQSPHARAFDVLSPDEKKDPRCLSCHTAVPADVQTTLQGVQCESCHGAARSYTPDYVMRDAELAGFLGLVAKPDANSCNRCHTDAAPSLTGFDFATKRELIKHWGMAPSSSSTPKTAPTGATAPAHP